MAAQHLRTSNPDRKLRARVHQEFKARMAVLVTVVFWGLSFVATKAALREISPTTLIFFRFGVTFESGSYQKSGFGITQDLVASCEDCFNDQPALT